MNRFSVPPLAGMTRDLAAVAAGRQAPDLVITGARILSTYSERILPARELWLHGGRIAAVRPAGECRFSAAPRYDAQNGVIAPGLVDPHLHIESSMMTACAYAEPALLNGTTTIFCDSHEIGNVLGAEGVEMMLADARQAPLSIFLTVPSTVPATSPELETAGGDLTAEIIGGLFDRWPEAVALGEKMDYVQVTQGNERSHAILAAALRRGRPVCGHIYGREFVAAYAASGVTDTHEAIDREIADDLLEAGLWIFLRGGPPTTPWHSLPQAIRALTELGAVSKRFCVCTDDRDADDLFSFGLDWVVSQAVAAGLRPEQAWSLGSLHPATRYGADGEIGGLGGGRRADLVLLDDDLEVHHTWYGGQLVVEHRKVTPLLEAALAQPYRYPAHAYRTVRCAETLRLLPPPPTGACVANVIRIESPGIVTRHERMEITPPPDPADWPASMVMDGLCFLAVVERYGQTGAVAHGLLKELRPHERRGGQQRGSRLAQPHRRGHQRAGHGSRRRRDPRLAGRRLRGGERAGHRDGGTPRRRVAFRQTRHGDRRRDHRPQAGLEPRRLHAALHGLQPPAAFGHPRHPPDRQGSRAGDGNPHHPAFRATMSRLLPFFRWSILLVSLGLASAAFGQAETRPPSAAPATPATPATKNTDLSALKPEKECVAVLASFPEELAAVESVMIADPSGVQTTRINGIEFKVAEIKGRRFVFFLTGMSLVNAAMNTQLVLDHFNVSAVFFSGIAGGIDPAFGPGDVVIPAQWSYHSEAAYFNETAPGKFKLASYYHQRLNNFGMIFPDFVTVIREGMDHWEQMASFPADPKLLAAAKAATDTLPPEKIGDRVCKVAFGGNGVSGTVFCDNAEYRKWVFEDWKAVCLDMESTAIAQVCWENKKPCLIVRGLSDLAGGQAGENQEEIYLQAAADHSAVVLTKILQNLAPAALTPTQSP